MDTRKKIVKVATLKRHIKRLRQKGMRIAFTNGCFDILHFGHVRYLEMAKRGDRILIIGLNSDSSVRKIKGVGRPINTQDVRAAVLAALSCVDYVTFFDQETPYQLIKILKPDILIKGADWKGREVVGSDIIEENGGRIELLPYISRFSTTKIVETIKGKCVK